MNWPILLPLLAAYGREPDLAYRIERVVEPELLVRVELTASGDTDGATELAVQDRWGGVDAGGEDLGALAARGAGGRELEVERPAVHRWSVRHEPGETLEITYEIAANAHQADAAPGANRRPIVNPEIFHAFGHLFLVVPEHLGLEERRTITLEWRGFEKAACSFAVGPGPHALELTLDELRHAVFLAGEVELLQRDVAGQPVWIAAHDRGFAFRTAEFADLVGGIVEIEREFFEDFERPFYLVTLIPVGVARPGSQSLGGTGLVDSFALQIQPGLDLAQAPDRQRLARLLAHEMFHDWNGTLLEREAPEELAYWFSEGFTDFFARRLLLRGGWTTVDEHVESLNATLRRYFTSPVRGEPNARILADFWNEREVQDLPYQRGDVVAMILDHAIRRASAGERSLDDFMRELVRRARAPGEKRWKVSTEKLVEEVARWTSPEVASAIRATVVDGATPFLDPATFAPCLALAIEEEGVFDLGFDLERSTAERRVHGVRDGSAASTVGLCDGQELVGWSVNHGDTTSPVRFTIREEGGERTIEYLPLGERVPVPRFSRARDGDAGCDVL